MADFMNCQFCSKLMDMFRPRSDDRVHQFGKLSDIIDMPCPHADSIHRLWERGLALHGRMDKAFETGSPQGWTVNTEFGRPLVLRFYLKGRLELYFVISLVSRPDKLAHPGSTTVLNPQWIDSSIPRAWYAKCLEEHGQECRKPSWMRLRSDPIAMPEWLVDVVDNCVVPCNSHTSRYITLSYTWGGVQCLKHTGTTIERLKQKGSLHPEQAPDVPRTVRDAFEITKFLGERYLWVDSLCIAQGEAAATKDLNSMHHIYANSMICLIALAGTDANHGLRGMQGISAPRHVEQGIFDMADGERFSWFVEPHRPAHSEDMRFSHNHLAREGSSYNERGWTYQEDVFAKRRLIFTDGPINWSCECAKWTEQSYGDTAVHVGSAGSEAWTSWMTAPGPDLRIIQDAADRFNTRYFTYEADISRAFLGIQNHISRDFLGGMNYGHPEMFFDISLLWRRDLAARSSSKRRVSCAANSDPPSWSWMGWKGEFYFDRDQEFLPGHSHEPDVGFTHSVAQWHTMNSALAPASDMRPVKCRWQIYRAAVETGSAEIPIGWLKVAKYREGSEHHYRRVPTDQGSSFFGSSHLHHSWDRLVFSYPVPLPLSTVGTKPIEQRPFVFARTSRCFSVPIELVDSELRPPWDSQRLKHLVGLFCREGKCGGLLQLQHALDAPCSPVELVAVVKGWTTAFSEYFLAFQVREEPEGKRWPTGSHLTHRKSYPRRHSCYFVLCVKWEDGVAKRQGSGMVEADIWEQNREPVDLILG